MKCMAGLIASVSTAKTSLDGEVKEESSSMGGNVPTENRK